MKKCAIYLLIFGFLVVFPAVGNAEILKPFGPVTKESVIKQYLTDQSNPPVVGLYELLQIVVQTENMDPYGIIAILKNTTDIKPEYQYLGIWVEQEGKSDFAMNGALCCLFNELAPTVFRGKTFPDLLGPTLQIATVPTTAIFELSGPLLKTTWGKMPTTQPINLLRYDTKKDLKAITQKLFGAKLQKTAEGNFLVMDVSPGTKSSKADLRVGDIITALDNKPSTDLSLNDAIKTLDSDRPIMMNVIRGSSSSLVYIRP